jgi:hypothetical protein
VRPFLLPRPPCQFPHKTRIHNTPQTSIHILILPIPPKHIHI